MLIFDVHAPGQRVDRLSANGSREEEVGENGTRPVGGSDADARQLLVDDCRYASRHL